MLLATKKDRTRVLEILEFSFQGNPGVNALIGRKNKIASLQKILAFSVDYGLRRKGLYLSEDKNCVAICYPFHSSPDTICDLYGKIKLISKAIPWLNIFKISAHRRTIKLAKPKHRNFLYFWYLGANSEASKNNSTQKLISDIFQMAKEKGLDIYAETTLLRNRIIYERFGFQTFKDWYNDDLGLRVWFMKKVLR